jgi:hypothetical protein
MGKLFPQIREPDYSPHPIYSDEFWRHFSTASFVYLAFSRLWLTAQRPSKG